MRLYEIGAHLRAARQARGLTQAQVAQAAGVSRATLNQLEGGALRDLGFAKVEAIAAQVGLTLDAGVRKTRHPDRLAMAATAASVGFREGLSTQQLLEALLKGAAPVGKRPHLRRLFEDSPPGFVRRLLDDLGRRTPPGRILKGVEKLAAELDLPKERIAAWTNPH